MPRKKQPPPPPPPPQPHAGRSFDKEGASQWFGNISPKSLERLTFLLDIPTHYVGRTRIWEEADLVRARQALERHKVPWSLRAESTRRRKEALSKDETDV